MKLFPKLALTVAGLLMATTVCLSLSFYYAEYRVIRLEAESERRTLLQNLIHITQESFLTNDDLLLVKYTSWIQRWNPALVSASVVNPQGEILSHSEPSQIGKSMDAAPTRSARTEVLVFTQPVRIGTQWVATASVAFSERQFENALEARLWELKRRIFWIASGAVTFGVAISFLLALSWTQPIHALAEAAECVGEGHYQINLEKTVRRRDELGYLSKSFRSMAARLQELDRLKDEFVSAVTHELRSPLGAIESYLNLIHVEIRDGISPSEWQTYLHRLRLNTNRLTRFVNDLLDVASLERGKIVLDVKPFDAAALLRELAQFYSAALDEKKLRCRTEFSLAPETHVLGDADKIRQVLTNLLSNAIKFTPTEGIVELGAEELPGTNRLKIYVKDSGPGIDSADQRRIFNKFEQVESTRRSIKGPKGTGLGLAISHALVERHGALLQVESRLGEGSRFYFSLPIPTT